MNVSTKSKFFKLVNSRHQAINEQGPNPLFNPAQMPQQPGEPIDPMHPQPPAEPQGEPEVQQLSSEGEVELIRLIRKALQINTDGDIPSEILEGEINEENGREMLSKIKRYISTYSDDPDIDY